MWITILFLFSTLLPDEQGVLLFFTLTVFLLQWFIKLPSWRAAKECCAYLPRPPPAPDPVARLALWREFRWKLECFCLLPLVYSVRSLHIVPHTDVSIPLDHIYASLVGFWFWRRLHDLQTWSGYAVFIKLGRSMAGLLYPGLALFLWCWFHPISFSPHTQLLFLASFGSGTYYWAIHCVLIFLRFMDKLGHKMDRPHLHVVVTRSGLALHDSPRQMHLAATCSLYLVFQGFAWLCLRLMYGLVWVVFHLRRLPTGG